MHTVLPDSSLLTHTHTPIPLTHIYTYTQTHKYTHKYTQTGLFTAFLFMHSLAFRLVHKHTPGAMHDAVSTVYNPQLIILTPATLYFFLTPSSLLSHLSPRPLILPPFHFSSSFAPLISTRNTALPHISRSCLMSACRRHVPSFDKQPRRPNAY